VTGNIYIILPVYNRREITKRFVDCLKKQSYTNYHLILIDDGSTDGSSEMVKEHIRSLTVIRGNGNWWWGGSLQQGYLWLRAQNVSATDLVLIINNDTEFGPDFLATGSILMQGQRNMLLLATGFSKQNGNMVAAGVHVDWKKLSFNKAESSAEINCLSTRGLFLHVSDLFKIGGFYPRLLPHYLSDYEFTIRAFRKGMKLCTDSKLKLWLDEETTGHRQVSYKNFNEYLKTYYSMRSIFNPFQWTAFIALACPWPWNLINGTRVWIHAIGTMSKACVIALRNAVRK